MFRLINQSLRMPLDGGGERECRVFEAFDDAVGGFGDDPEAAAETVGGLFVVGIDRNVGLADGAAYLGGGIQRGIVAEKRFADFAVFDGTLSGDFGKKLVHAAAAVDIHEL